MPSTWRSFTVGLAAGLTSWWLGREPDGLAATGAGIVACLGVAVVARGRRSSSQGAAAVAQSEQSESSDTPPSESREDLLTNTAHELRTPLTVVMASIGMLREGFVETETDRQATLEQASAACQLLAFLINDLLDEAAAEAGKLRLEPKRHAVRQLVGNARDLLAPIAKVRGMSLAIQTPEVDLSIDVDAMRLQQVLFNLVGNALKFAPDGSTVELHAIEDGARLRFEVRDAGAGIPVQHRARIFERFSRIESGDGPSIVGSGIGLHVCQLLVEQMGGSIDYREPELGRGSVFWFDLPALVRAPELVSTG